jgi:hypothetical protein
VTTPQPTPVTTPQPTPVTTPQPTPVPAVAPAHPPCPTADAPPPGHNKGADPQGRPCNGGKKGNDGGPVGGVLLVPLGAVGMALGWWRPLPSGRGRLRWLRGPRRER